MDAILVRIKRAVIIGNLVFTEKATVERERDGLSELDVAESILNAVAVYKTIRSNNPRANRREYLHIIQGTNYAGMVIYTKGKLVENHGIQTYYLLVSAKQSEFL